MSIDVFKLSTKWGLIGRFPGAGHSEQPRVGNERITAMTATYLELKGRLEGLSARKEAYAAENTARAAIHEPPLYGADVFLALAESMEAVADEERVRAAGYADAASLKEKTLAGISPIAALIRRRRLAVQMTQPVLAKSVGCTLAVVRKWELAKAQPGSRWSESLARALGGISEEYHNIQLAQVALVTVR